ncbi:MAG: lipopolysaccharide biosynthesis protein [Nanobdellota archaeon]
MAINKKKSLGNGLLKDKFEKVMGDSLYRNSIYLMLSSAVMALFGFFFWLICARLFPAEQIGLATTIISVMGLVASFSVLGLNTGLIRYLPNAKDKSKKINTTFTIVALVTIIVSCIFLIGIKEFSPRLVFIKENIILSFAFIIFMIVNSLGSMVESVFVAFRKAKFVLVKNSVFSVVKLGMPFLFIAYGSFGIFSAYMSAMLIGFGVVLLILIFKFNYHPKFVFYDSVIMKMGRYSFGNYVAGFIGGLPLMLIPLMITNLLHPETTAYYYMAMMIASLLFVIPSATTNSLFAEGSHNEKGLKKNVTKSIWIISLLLIPAILITMLFGKYILLAFGKEYSAQGFNFLRLMALSGIFVSVNSIFGSVFRVKKRIREIIVRSIVGCIVILGLSYLFIHQGLGLMGIAYAYMIGQIIIAVFYWMTYKKKEKVGKNKKNER